MPIQKLSALLINQIAAGEVIERPASVVKELVENSLDAGARRVEVVVEEGGLGVIRVSDDGWGIPEGELLLAVAAHATSKLERLEQLGSMGTLGFRGEALASIASVSRLRVTSRAMVGGRVAEAGAVIEASGEAVSPVGPAGCAAGTVVEVRDLFFNTPARRKFVRSAATEWGHICEVMTRMAMAHPEVGFGLSQGSRVYLDVPGGQSPRRRWVELLGKELDELLLDFEASHGVGMGGKAGSGGGESGVGVMRVWGLAGKPELAKATGQYQYFFVNRRVVRDRTLGHAVREAYRGLMAPNQQPVVVLSVEVAPGSVDVNVHPTKAEVRFVDSNRVHGVVLTAIRQRLLGSDLTPGTPGPPGIPAPGSVGPGTPGSSGFFRPLGTSGGVDEYDVAAGGGLGATASPQAFVEYFRRMQPQQKGLVFREVQQAMAEDRPLLARLAEEAGSAGSGVEGPVVRVEPSQTAALAQRVLQVHGTYLVTQDEQGLVIIDQHALHERVMFEQLRSRVLAGRLESQRLLTPAVVEASPGRMAQLPRLGGLLEKIGIELEPIGPGAIAVQAFPSFLFDRHVEPGEFVEQLLDRAQAGDLSWGEDVEGNSVLGAGDQTVREAVLHEVLDMMACKAAVKGGDRLTPEELGALLEQRQAVERSSSCPHGRPTSHRITLKELEKRFKRT